MLGHMGHGWAKEKQNERFNSLAQITITKLCCLILLPKTPYTYWKKELNKNKLKEV